MKKFYTLTAALLFSVGFINAQCTPGSSTTEFDPQPGSVPNATLGVQYDEVLQFYIPFTKDITILGYSLTADIDSVVLNDVTGLPAGLTWTASPGGPLYLPGTNGCGRTLGIATTAGQFPISFDGRIYFHIDTVLTGLPVIGTYHVDFDTSFTIDQYLSTEYGESYSLTVVDPTGIKDFNADLNSMLSLYPNPSTGAFTFDLKAGERVNGEIVVTDVTGRKVFTQNIDVVGIYSTVIDLSNQAKGLYTVQLRTANGFASRNISVE